MSLSLREPLRRLLLNRPTPTADYGTMVKAPGTVVDDSGNYRAGWLESFPAVPGADRAQGSAKRFHKWFFVHFDTPDYFVGFDIVDLALGGNVGIVVLDRRTGEFKVASDSDLLWNNNVVVDGTMKHFSCWPRRSSMRHTKDRIHFDVRAGNLRVQGFARALFERPFIQCTAFHKGHGVLQDWGNVVVEQANLWIGDEKIELPRGSFGAYDRSVGHRRPVENWNWLVAVGEAVHDSGRKAPFAIHLAKDGPAATPHVVSDKYAVWVDGKLHKLDDVQFAVGGMSAWSVWSSSDASHRLDLVFEPHYHRRDRHNVPLLFRVDHSQYFGPVRGRIETPDGGWQFEKVMATAEDSKMVC
jgi:hypothetical protein